MGDDDLYRVETAAAGPSGALPLTADFLRDSPSGDVFGLTQNAGMGWEASKVGRDQFLILSTQGGVRADDGTPVALGYHTGHWEVGLLVREAAEELDRLGGLPFAAHVSDPCDGRTQGTTGMFDSLPYRNDAALVLRRLVRSLPRRRGVIGVGTCDKGLPAMLMAVASFRELAGRRRPRRRHAAAARGEDAGAVQTLGARFAHGLVTLEDAADLGCRACASPGGGCQFLGTAATSQVVAEALGLTVPHAALAPSGQPIWLDVARRTARAVHGQWQRRPHRSTTCSRTRRSRTRCSSTRRSAARRTCSSTSPRSPMRPACAADRRGLAPRQPLRCRGSSTRSRTARGTTRRYASSSPAASPR